MSLIKEDIYIYNELLSRHTSFKIGGPAKMWVEPRDEDELKEVIADLKASGTAYRVIGNGSNILADDAGVPWAVIKLSHFNKIFMEEGYLTAQGGAGLNSLIRFSIQNNLSGLEFLSGIPGTVGGAVKTNAGAYGSEISKVLNEILVLDSNGNTSVIERREIEFGYRYLGLSNDSVILSAKFNVKRCQKGRVKTRVEEILNMRKEKIPYGYPNAGSVFKNPEKYSSGEVIDRLGLKGLSIKNAMVSTRHANVIINFGKAKASDIKKLISYIKNCVYAKTGILLSTEIEYW